MVNADGPDDRGLLSAEPREDIAGRHSVPSPWKPPGSAVTLETELRLTQCQEKQEERQFHSKSNIDNKLFKITTDEGGPSVLLLSKRYVLSIALFIA